jgi:hypothetical protein
MSDTTPPVPPVPPADGSAPPPPAAPEPPAAPSATPPVAPAAPAQPTYPAYGQQPAQGYYAPPTNTLAILALVLGIVIPIGGIICGHIALGQIKRTGEGGRGLAMAGLIIGYGLTALTLIFIIIYIAVIAWAINAGSGSYYY